MTPIEVKQLVDAAIMQRDGFNLIWLSLIPIISILGSLLASYLTEKGKSIATKEDIGQITRIVESSKTEFTDRLEHLRSDLASRSHYSKLRYERELKIYEDL